MCGGAMSLGGRARTHAGGGDWEGGSKSLLVVFYLQTEDAAVAAEIDRKIQEVSLHHSFLLYCDFNVLITLKRQVLNYVFM